LYEHEIQLEPFSAKALACLPLEGPKWTIPSSEVEKRRDLRSSHRIFSVDPPGCQDIDDTMHAKGKQLSIFFLRINNKRALSQ